MHDGGEIVGVDGKPFLFAFANRNSDKGRAAVSDKDRISFSNFPFLKLDVDNEVSFSPALIVDPRPAIASWQNPVRRDEFRLRFRR